VAGVWGEPSPQVPPEARPNLGRSGDPTEWGAASQPWAEGAGGGEREREGGSGCGEYTPRFVLYSVVPATAHMMAGRIDQWLM